MGIVCLCVLQLELRQEGASCSPIRSIHTRTVKIIIPHYSHPPLYITCPLLHVRNRTPMRRHTTGNFPQKEAHEKGPFDENMYKKSEELTKGIYAVTIKDKGTAKDEEAGRG